MCGDTARCGGLTMDERINETAVPWEHERERLDVYLAGRFTYLSRTAWRREIERGRVYLNHERVESPGRRVRGGDIVRFDGRGFAEPEVDDRFSVLYEDEHLVCIDKPGNLPVHPAGRYFNNTLVRILQARGGAALFPVHRLDRETSGVILLAKRGDVASQIQRGFGNVKKSYIAIVHGAPANREFEINVPILDDPAGEIRKKRVASASGGECALTRFRALFSFGDYTLMRAFPETGRLHQIRVHLRHAGLPIVGDKLYGRDERLFGRFLREGLTGELLSELELPRSALHSRSLRFFHPLLRRELLVKAPVPSDFREFIAEKGGRRGRTDNT
ncbi:MAG: RluA family pseudouridine synthase [Spirochaetota bacterium]|nr:RluA family pseudouridine synthase [Spirochaetota bacterium]